MALLSCVALKACLCHCLFFYCCRIQHLVSLLCLGNGLSPTALMGSNNSLRRCVFSSLRPSLIFVPAVFEVSHGSTQILKIYLMKNSLIFLQKKMRKVEIEPPQRFRPAASVAPPRRPVAVKAPGKLY